VTCTLLVVGTHAVFLYIPDEIINHFCHCQTGVTKNIMRSQIPSCCFKEKRAKLKLKFWGWGTSSKPDLKIDSLLQTRGILKWLKVQQTCPVQQRTRTLGLVMSTANPQKTQAYCAYVPWQAFFLTITTYVQYILNKLHMYLSPHDPHKRMQLNS
jgi:hypothetical protein